MATYYVSSVAWTAVAAWAATHAYILGDYVRQLATPTFGNERVFKCTTAGTSGGTEPAWTLTDNGNTTDSTAVWKQIAGQEAEQAAGNWKAPYATMLGMQNAHGLVGGDQIFVSSDHTESNAAAYSLSGASVAGSGPAAFYSVSRVGASLPPTATDLAAGAIIGTSGSQDITFANHHFYYRGFFFVVGTGASAASLNFGRLQGAKNRYELCDFKLNTTSNAAIIRINTRSEGSTEWINCTATFGATGQMIRPDFGSFLWRNRSSSSALGGATFPTTLIGSPSGNNANGRVTLDGLDLSALSGIVLDTIGYTNARMVMRNCKLHASATPLGINLSQQTHDDIWGQAIENCDDSTNNRSFRMSRRVRFGRVDTDSGPVRTGGASDGVTPISWKLSPMPAASGYQYPLITPRISARVGATGVSTMATACLLYTGQAEPTNRDIWVELTTLDSFTSPISTTHSSKGPFIGTGTTLSADTSAWDASVPLRQNSHSYAVGDLIKVASNPGYVFVCISAFNSAASEPGGYATAVDGTNAIADGGSSWRCCWRKSISISWTPQRVGVVSALVCYSRQADSVYVDPHLVIA